MQDNSRDSWRGIYPAMLTPLNQDESIDEDACIHLISHLAESCKGLYLTGGTGEEYGISDSVRMDVFQIAVSTAKGKIKLIAHIGGVHTLRAVKMVQAACKAGVDAVSALPPHGGKYSFSEIFSFYKDIAEVSNVPLFIYYIPQTNGYKFSL